MQSTIDIPRMIEVRYVLLYLALGLLSCQPSQQEMKTPSESEQTALPKWITIDYVMGRFDPSEHEDFVKIDEAHADREGLYLRTDAYEDFKAMHAAAQADGVSLVIRSAARNFEYQKGIWERKWFGTTQLSDGSKASDIAEPKARALKILLYSSMPGSSRHHWGTDIDLNSFNNEYFDSGEGKLVYDWLKKHAADYGFCQPYTDKSEGRTGYEEERWHWTYLPISIQLTQYCELYLKDNMISGFAGSNVSTDIGVVRQFVLGIASECK